MNTSHARPSIAAATAMLTALLLAPVRSAPAADQLAAAESAAKAGGESPEGKTFGEAVGQAFGREHASTIQGCAKSATRRDLSNFDLFLRIGESGVVDHALVTPATPLATCVKDKMPGWKVSTPPAEGFWVKVGVSLKSK